MKELASPIRMYWDLDAEFGIDPARVADEIIANKLLTLQITLAGRELARAGTALERLQDKQPAVSLVLPLSAFSDESLSLVRKFPIKLLLISISSVADLKSILPIQNQIPRTQAFGVAFPVTRHNFRSLPEVLQFCGERQVQHFVLPLQRLIGNEEAFVFCAKERNELASELNRIARPASLRITIHDPFLWRAFFPSIEFPDGGCQAANTMLYISPNGDVYPCPSMPVTIGNIVRAPLKDFISSDLKKAIRKNIINMPAGCSGCEELKICKGGCRGRAYAVNRSFSTNDPACR